MFQHHEPGNVTGHALYPSKRKFISTWFQFSSFRQKCTGLRPCYNQTANKTVRKVAPQTFLTSSDLPLDSSFLLLGH